MSKQADTPRTERVELQMDALFEEKGESMKAAGYAYAAMTRHARTLEREASELREALQKIMRTRVGRHEGEYMQNVARTVLAKHTGGGK